MECDLLKMENNFSNPSFNKNNRGHIIGVGSIQKVDMSRYHLKLEIDVVVKAKVFVCKVK